MIRPPLSSIVETALKEGILEKSSCERGSVPLLKKVMNTEGDTVTFQRESHVLGQEVFLLGTHELSFDSRAFGPVSTNLILGTATPLLTIDGPIFL